MPSQIYTVFFEEAPTIQKSTSQSMGFQSWFAISGYLAYAAGSSSLENFKVIILSLLFGFLSVAAICACVVGAVKKLGYKAEDVDIGPMSYLGMINGIIISLLIVRQCQ